MDNSFNLQKHFQDQVDLVAELIKVQHGFVEKTLTREMSLIKKSLSLKQGYSNQNGMHPLLKETTANWLSNNKERVADYLDYQAQAIDIFATIFLKKK